MHNRMVDTASGTVRTQDGLHRTVDCVNEYFDFLNRISAFMTSMVDMLRTFTRLDLHLVQPRVDF
jgi:hypothetical protein